MRLHHAALAVALLLVESPAQALGPQSPCALAGAPAYPSPDAPPTIRIWQGKELDQVNWHAPSCTGWPEESRSRLIVTLSGSFHFDGPMSALLARVGTISALRSIQYWSTTDRKWGPLSNDASALTGPDSKSRRADFSASELVKGAELYYWEDDTRTGPAFITYECLKARPSALSCLAKTLRPYGGTGSPCSSPAPFSRYSLSSM